MSGEQAAPGGAVDLGRAAAPAPGDRRSAAGGRWGATAAVGAVALVARLGYWAITADRPLRSDAAQYHHLAANVADGRGFVDTFPQLASHPTAFRPPLLPAVLAVPYRVVGAHPGVGRAVAVLLGVALVVVVHRVVARHLGWAVATGAALLVAVSPSLVANDVVPLTESLSLLLLVAVVDLAVRRRWLAAGAVCGLLVLARPSAQGLVVLLVVWSLLAGRARAPGRSWWDLRDVRWRAGLAVALACAAVVAPWVLRNAVQLGAPVVVTSNGFNLAAMHSPESRQVGAFVDPVVHPGFDDVRLAQFDEVAWDRALRARAVDEISSRPWGVAPVVARNLAAHLELRPDFNVRAEEADGRHLGVRNATLPLFYLVAGAGAVGLWRERRNPFVALLALCALWFAATSLLLVAPPRLRAPLDLACCVGAAVVAVPAWRRVAGPTGRDVPGLRSG